MVSSTFWTCSPLEVSMDIKSLLNQALKSDLVKQGTQKLSQGSSSLSGLSQGNNGKSSSKSTLGAFGAGAVGGGLLGALMGSKKPRKWVRKPQVLVAQQLWALSLTRSTTTTNLNKAKHRMPSKLNLMRTTQTIAC
ncbi:hypothetical protein VCRA2120E57_450010 [Vibrio crassostreae]|nr:hypothetical protein VCRA2120E57_450010 [Vibrio crassostreae]